MNRKLIRDRLDGSKSPWGAVTVRPVKDEHEHFQLLLEKLVEEAQEVLAAHRADTWDFNKILEEYADLQEVLLSLKHMYAIRDERVQEVMLAKRIEKGGFLIGKVMEEVVPIQQGSELLVYEVEVDCLHWKDPQFSFPEDRKAV